MTENNVENLFNSNKKIELNSSNYLPVGIRKKILREREKETKP